jgi:hypothetical protein
MRLGHAAVVGFAGIVLSTSPPVAAHEPCCGHHHHHGCAPEGRGPFPGSGAGLYDPDTVTTLRGPVVDVSVVPARGGRAGGTHLKVQADGRTLDVHLGPTWFLESQGLAVAKGDAVEVTGSLVELEGSEQLIARELKTGGRVLRLRDERGAPAWAGAAGRR